MNAGNSLPFSTRPFRQSMAISVMMLAAAVTPAVSAEVFFIGPKSSDTPDSWAEWEDAASWFGGVGPTSADIIRIYKQNAADRPTSARLSSAFDAFQITVSHNSDLYLASGANLRMNGANTDGDGRLFVTGAETTGAGTLTIASGASLSWASSEKSSASLLVDKGGVVVNRGNLTVSTADVMAGGKIILEDGVFTSSRSNGLRLLGGSIIQTGGETKDIDFVRFEAGEYRISGGSFNIGTLQYFGGALHVDGSGASQINVTAYRQDTVDYSANFIFTLDHTADHVTRVNITGTTREFHLLRLRGSLEMRLQGGVLLTDQSQFTLIERGKGISDGAGWLGAPGALWKDTTATEGERNYIRVGFAEAANQGTLSEDSGPLSFAAIDQGYIDLVGFDLDEPITLSLDLTQNSALFEAALTAAGIEWQQGGGDYELLITLNAALTGATYFAWDFHDIDPSLLLQGVAVGAIPEPGTWALLGAAGVAGSLVLRRRKGSAE